jgi:tRNA(Ile)-lysidine synthetase-like protein
MNKKTGTKVVISDDCEAMVSYDYLHIGKSVQTATNLEVVQVKDMIGKTVQVGSYFIKTSIIESDEPIVNNEFTYHYPIDDSYENLMFRTRRAGDMLQMTEHMSKKVNRFFTDKKIPANERDNFWMLCHNMGFVYWIPELFGSRWETRTGKFVRFEIC